VGKVMVDLLAFYGEGRRSMVKRWLRLGRFLPEEVVEFLADFEQLRPKFLYDNVYFCGTGASAQQRLGGRFGVAVLQILRGNPSEYKSGSWQEILCKPAKCVELWIKILYMRFGSVAKESPAPPARFPARPAVPDPPVHPGSTVIPGHFARFCPSFSICRLRASWEGGALGNAAGGVTGFPGEPGAEQGDQHALDRIRLGPGARADGARATPRERPERSRHRGKGNFVS